MEKGKKNRKKKMRTRYYVPIIFIISVLLVAYAFPRQGKFKYSFSEGKPWQSGLLTAPIDFSIYKPAAQLKAEQDSLLLFFEPYYNINNDVKKASMAELDADISTNPKFTGLPQNYKLYIRDKISKIYDDGIMSSDDYDNIAASITQSFRLKDGKKAETKNIKDFHTIKSAYQKVIDEKPESIDANILRNIDLNNYIKENIIFDETTTAKAKKDFIHNVMPTSGMVQQGQRIIGEGEIVDANTYNILLSLKKVTEEKSGGSERSAWVILGQIIMITILFGMFYLYLLFFRPNEYHNRKHLIFMLLLIDIFILLTALTVRFDLFSVYIIPYAIVTILIRTFIDSRTALFASIVTIVMCALMVPFPFEFIVIQILVAMVAVFMLKELAERSQLIRSSFFILLTYVLVYVGLVMFQEGNINKVNWEVLVYFIINFIFIMFSYTLVYLVEKSFGFISGVSMVELSNINKPLLKELSEKAPGTFQHSMQVSNLGMAAAMKIGANASLIRTGALYHDIGKMVNPGFFTENQTPGINPHAGLPFEESARIIINHVKDGVKIAQREGLPKQIIDFIETHHGTSMPKYFYVSWKNANPGKEINESLFRYPGPNPFSKETAIMMMADGIEASSRSLPEYTEEIIAIHVNKIIDSMLQDGMFKRAPITFREVEIVKEVFIEKLKTIYHSRIAYPELNQQPQIESAQKSED
ncbi:MAG: HDIG domain-containing protein [Dysgonamonadaceae bacterium]|jgi:hypothetical protein|nr:HDIG domain-containing protein [Dysgonamonadaceae bacterium]